MTLPFKRSAKNPLEGIPAFGMGYVIAGAGIGRDLAYYGADVLNIWRPDDTEVEAFAWDVQVGMRSAILDGSKQDRAKFDRLLNDADVFFSNRQGESYRVFVSLTRTVLWLLSLGILSSFA